MEKVKICAVYLAAGQSRRMGENKLALPLGEKTVGSLALQTALKSELDHIIVVAKEDDCLEWIATSFFENPFKEKWSLARCHDAILGQAYSLKCGLKAARELNPDGIMILLADQPFLNIKTINEILLIGEQVQKENDSRQISYIGASFHGIPKPPILFFQQSFPFLLELNGDEGARQLFRKSLLKGKLLEVRDETIFYDLDTKEDYDKALNRTI
jgi:molybdenum cofactor cytidylyltransferase